MTLALGLATQGLQATKAFIRASYGFMRVIMVIKVMIIIVYHVTTIRTKRLCRVFSIAHPIRAAA